MCDCKRPQQHYQLHFEKITLQKGKLIMALFAVVGVCGFIFVLTGSYAAWMLTSFLVYKIRDNGTMTLREFSQDW